MSLPAIQRFLRFTTFYGLNEKAHDAIRKAYELDPNDAMVVGRLGTYYLNKGDLVQAFHLTKRCIELDPTNSFAYFTMGTIYCDLADFNQAELFLKKSLELQPDFAFSGVFLVRLYISQGKFDQAMEAAKRLSVVNDKIMFDLMGLTEAMSENYPKAAEHFYKGSRLFLEGRFAHVLFKMGRIEEANKILTDTKNRIMEELKIDRKNQDWLYFLAAAFMIEGNKEESFKYLQKACESGYWYYSFVERDPVFKAARNDPQFQSAIECMKAKIAEARRQLGM